MKIIQATKLQKKKEIVIKINNKLFNKLVRFFINNSIIDKFYPNKSILIIWEFF